MKKHITLLLALLLCGCSADKPYEISFFAMDTLMTMKAYGSNSKTALDAAENRIRELDEKLSVNAPSGEIYALNNSGRMHLSDDTARLVEKACLLCKETGGALDITLLPVEKAWGFTTGEYHIPDEEALSALLEKTGYENIRISGSEVSMPDGFSLDTGAVAKGFAGDEAVRILSENGIDSAVINLGGNVMAIGSRPDGTPWKIAVADPFSPDEYICTLSVTDSAVITSGNYQRYFTGDDGRRYCHIIDPVSGHPTDNGIASVTVTGRSGTECDGLSTALFVMGKERAEEFYREHDGFEMMIISDSGEISATENISKNITLTDSDRTLTVIRK